MLVKMPRGPIEQNRPSALAECDPFEAALRRDLASTPVVSYEATIGGLAKRCFDVAAAALSAPFWLAAILVAAAAARLRHRAPVFEGDERVGYGGRIFRCLRLRLDPPAAEIAILRPSEAPANDLAALALRAEDRRANWRHAIERMPQMLNVLRGDMSLVGPAPLTREEVEPLKTAKRYYLSARPGVVGVSALAQAGETRGGQYKIYSLCWSLATDVNLIFNAVANLNTRGELWKPVRSSGAGRPRGEPAAAGREAGGQDRIGV